MSSDSLTKIQEVRRDKKVGIVITDKAQIFSNGLVQNAYFIHQCLEHLGMKCQFLCYESTPAPFEYKDLSVKPIGTNPLEFDPSEYHTIITISASINHELYIELKKARVFVVSFVCGNQLMHHMEDFVRGTLTPGVTTYIGKGSYCDEVWVIPGYAHSVEYISLTRGKPAFVIPHLWSPCILADMLLKIHSKPETHLFYDYTKHVGKKIDLIILEPNLALFKNAWIPIMSAEKLYLTNKDLIDNVYVFNFPKHGTSYSMTDNLEIAKDKKLRYFSRLAIVDIMLYFNQKDNVPIIVSHQMLNSLNYVYYEALYYGWPLVHNSPDLDGCGYFYPENNITACADAIQHAYLHHNRNLECYKDKAKEYLKRVDPLDADMGKIWNGFLNAGIAKCLSST